jgi:hypothetical protein
MALASRGLRDMDQGIERIEDAEEALVVRGKARRVLLKSVAATVAVVVALMLLP